MKTNCSFARISIGILLVIFVSGCVTPQYNYQPTATNVSYPAINSVNTAYVGDELLKQGKLIERDAIFLDHSLKIVSMGSVVLSRGYYVKIGENEESDFYEPASGPDGGTITKGPRTDPWKAVQLYKNKNRICIVTVYNVSVGTDANGVRRCKHSSLADNSFQQTLIYSGKVGSKVRIGYREFSNNLARPAFSNDVEYEVSESSIIGYKGARVEVIEATNEYMKYRVLQNFGKLDL